MTSRIKKISDKRLKELGGKVPFSTIRKKKRPASETVRIYGPPARRAFVKTLDCAACGISGFSENAHVAPKGEKGTGYKADARWIAPLCGIHPEDDGWTYSIKQGCHFLFDELHEAFKRRFPSFDATRAAQETEKAWQESQK